MFDYVIDAKSEGIHYNIGKRIYIGSMNGKKILIKPASCYSNIHIEAFSSWFINRFFNLICPNYIIINDNNIGECGVQDFIEDTITIADYLWRNFDNIDFPIDPFRFRELLIDSSFNINDMISIDVLDYILSNKDRHASNCILNPLSDRLIPIDHEHALSEDYTNNTLFSLGFEYIDLWSNKISNSITYMANDILSNEEEISYKMMDLGIYYDRHVDSIIGNTFILNRMINS